MLFRTFGEPCIVRKYWRFPSFLHASTGVQI